MTTDARGHYRVVALAPDVVVRLVMDSASLTSPWWVPGAALYVRATAGRLTRLDYSVVVGGIVTGRVSAVAGGLPLPPGAHVLLRTDSAAAGPQQRADVFSDGGFSLSGVPPGAYWATVEPPARDTSWRARPVRVVVPAGLAALDATGPVVDDVTLVLRRGDADDASAADTGGTVRSSRRRRDGRAGSGHPAHDGAAVRAAAGEEARGARTTRGRDTSRRVVPSRTPRFAVRRRRPGGPNFSRSPSIRGRHTARQTARW